MLGILIGFILTLILVGVGGFFLYQKLSPAFGLPGANQPAGNSNPINGANQGGNYGSPSPSQQQGSQSNGTLFGCSELKLVGTQTLKSGVPFTVQNTDSKPHKITISITEYDFAAGESEAITVNGGGIYQPVCDGAKFGELNIAE